MQVLVTLDGEDAGQVEIDGVRPQPGETFLVVHKDLPVHAIVVGESVNLDAGRITLKCLRPETYNERK